MNNSNPQETEILPFKKLLFGVIFFFLIIFLLEFLLSFAGLEKYDKEFMPRSSYPIFVKGEGELSDYNVTSSHFSRYINNQAFLRKKPTDLTRIFIVGGSAAFAWPYTEEYGFSGYLRRALTKAAPGKFEIINAAGMSFGSHRVLDVLKDVMLFEPDLVIVYSGNNEYVERNVLPDVKKPSKSMETFGRLLGRMDLYRAVRLAIYKISPAVFQKQMKQDITDIRANPDVERGALGRSSEIDREVLKNYQQNIRSMQELLVANDIKGIFSTVPVNIGGWLPTVADPQFKNDQDLERWLELFELKEAAFNRGDISQEEKLLNEMIEITPNDAGMIFNYGKVLWNQGSLDSSYRELIRAKDLDLRPMRALSSFNETILSIIDEGGNIHLVDMQLVLREKHLHKAADEFFLDYCHLTETGHKLVAAQLIPVMQIALGNTIPAEQLLSYIAADNKADTKEDYVRGHELYAQAITYQNNGRLDQAIETYKQVLALLGDFTSALSNLGNIYLDLGRKEDAEKVYKQAIEADPKNLEALTALGNIYLNRNAIGEAEKLYLKALQVNPYFPSATAGLGDIAMRRKETQKAINFYEETLKLGRDNARLRLSLAGAYLALGDIENAVRNWKTALQFNPYDQKARALVEKYSL